MNKLNKTGGLARIYTARLKCNTSSNKRPKMELETIALKLALPEYTEWMSYIMFENTVKKSLFKFLQSAMIH